MSSKKSGETGIEKKAEFAKDMQKSMDESGTGKTIAAPFIPPKKKK